MKTPKTPIEFDYNLWTTEDGKCMVRVKITGEVTEVDREVMKALRAEEKRIRRALRSNEGTVKDGIAHQTRTFSLSAVSENELEKSDWLVDPPRTPGFSKLGVLCWIYKMSCRTLVRQPRLFFYYINYVVSIAHSVTSPFFNHASMLTHLRALHELCLNSS